MKEIEKERERISEDFPGVMDSERETKSQSEKEEKGEATGEKEGWGQ
jgi:hypothetical protein